MYRVKLKIRIPFLFIVIIGLLIAWGNGYIGGNTDEPVPQQEKVN